MILAVVMAAAATANPCAAYGTALYVNAAERRLYVCERGQAKESLPVALGSGGIDKRKQGDAKLPLGEYALGQPRGSTSFHAFIPVGYPTAEQRRQGYTGGDVGVHGPPRSIQGRATTALDWTLGCVAVGTDEEIDRIARWVSANQVRRVVIKAK